MLISHKNKFVLTRPMKVGSTSAQFILITSGLLGAEDYHSGIVENIFDGGFFNTQLPETCTATKPELIHATPTKLQDLGLLSEEQVQTYTFINLIRNPVDRFMSAWLMEVIGGFYIGDSKKLFFDMLETKDTPYMISTNSLKAYSYHKNKLLPNIKFINTKNLIPELGSFCGKSLEPVQLKESVKLPWMVGKYTNYLPKTALKALKTLLAEDIDFYETITGEVV